MIKLPMKTTVFLVSVTSPLPPPYVPRLDITQVIYIYIIDCNRTSPGYNCTELEKHFFLLERLLVSLLGQYNQWKKNEIAKAGLRMLGVPIINTYSTVETYSMPRYHTLK